jgi:hypothetical protein
VEGNFFFFIYFLRVLLLNAFVDVDDVGWGWIVYEAAGILCTGNLWHMREIGSS